MPQCEDLELQDLVRTAAVSKCCQERAKHGHRSEGYSLAGSNRNDSQRNQISGRDTLWSDM